MKLIKRTDFETHTEIQLEKRFLFCKWETTYVRYDRTIFRYKYPNEYFKLSLAGYLTISEYFSISNTKDNEPKN